MRVVPDLIWGAMTIWMEGRSEGWDGQVCIAEIIRERTFARDIPDHIRKHMYDFMPDGNVSTTVLWPYQFSCWNTKDPNRMKAAFLSFEDKMFDQCLRAWNFAIEKETHLTQHALFYFNPAIVTVMPKWVDDCVRTIVSGKHHFYKPRDANESLATTTP